MSRSNRSNALALCILLVGMPAAAQTIQQYAEAQRKAVTQEVNKAYGVSSDSGSAGVGAAPAAAASPAAPKVVQVAYRPSKPPEPAIHVAGVVGLKEDYLVEVVVNGAAHLVPAGVRVPGTNWYVRDAEVSRVVLLKPATPGVKQSKDQTRVVALPSPEVR